MNLETQMVSGYADLGDLKMYYEIHGSGEVPLVLIHGGGSTIESTFGRILPLLAVNFKIIAVELQAHGRTSDRNVPLSFTQDADDVAALLKQMEVTKANFLGFSNGGNTAMQIALRHGHLVNKLILASSFYQRQGMIPGFFEGMQNASLENMPAPLKEAFLNAGGNKQQLQVMHDKDKSRMLDFHDWHENDLRAVTMPVLIINSDRDVVLPEHALEMSRLFPDCRLVIFPGQHGGYLGEICTSDKNSKMPQVTSVMIEEFLRYDKIR